MLPSNEDNELKCIKWYKLLCYRCDQCLTPKEYQCPTRAGTGGYQQLPLAPLSVNIIIIYVNIIIIIIYL